MENEILRINERIKIALDTGESHFREFKSALSGPEGNKQPRQTREVCVDIAQTLVAFANADGGELIVGIEDDSTVSGILHSNEDISRMINAPQTHVHSNSPLRHVKVMKVEYESKVLLYFLISKSSERIHTTSDGKCLQRKDRESIPIPPNEISFQRQEIKSREYDRQFVDGATIADLDIEQIREMSECIFSGLSPEKFLQHMDLAEYTPNGLKIKRATLILFSKHISKWHPRCQVRLLKVDGIEVKSGDSYNALEIGLISGNVLSVISDTWEKLRPFLVQTKLSSGAIFEIRTMYPELACKETIINAIAHRDYSVEGRGIEIYIYNDRMEVKSPGCLLSSITIENIKELKGAHESRNSLIARILREKGFMQELGEGVRRIFTLFKQNELTEPEFVSDDETFSVILHHKSVYTDEQKLWLDLFKEDMLEQHEKSVVLLGFKNKYFSFQDIWDTLGIVDTEEYRKIVHSLQTKGILASIPNAKSKAKSAKIPYRQFDRFYILKPDQRGKARIQVGRTDNFEPSYENAKIYITNLPYTVSNKELYEIFSQQGTVVDISIPKNYETNMPRGFAFITFESAEQAATAISKYNLSNLGGRRIAVSKAYKRK